MCYWRDAKWKIGHWCTKRELSVMLIEDEERETKSGSVDSLKSPSKADYRGIPELCDMVVQR